MPTSSDLAPEIAAEPRFEAYVRRHQRMVWRYLRLLGADAEEADDLMQETFLRLPWTNRDDPTPGYLRTAARNLLIDARRADRRRPPTGDWSKAVDELIAEDQSVLTDGRLEALRLCVDRLSGRARAAVMHHYFEGLDYREVGQRLALRLNGIKTLLARTRRALHDCITRTLAT